MLWKAIERGVHKKMELQEDGKKGRGSRAPQETAY